MNKLEKFNNVLDEMETEVSKFKDMNKVHQKLDGLARDYESVVSALSNAHGDLSRISQEYQKFQGSIQDKIEAIEKQQTQNKKDITDFLTQKINNIKEQINSFQANASKTIEDKINDFKKQNNDFSTDLKNTNNENRKLQISIQERIESISQLQADIKQDISDFLAKKMSDLQTDTQENIKTIEKNIINLIDNLAKDNKQFYKDFEDTLRIKLAESKSEIKHLVEAELSKVKEVFALELEKKTTIMQQQSANIIKKQGNLFLLFLLTSGTMIGSLIFIIYRILKY